MSGRDTLTAVLRLARPAIVVLVMAAACSGSPPGADPPIEGVAATAEDRTDNATRLLVTQEVEVAVIPAVIPCAAFPEEAEQEWVAVRSGIVVGGDAFGTPVEALEAFLAQGSPDGRQTLPQQGYLAMTLAGAIVYGYDPVMGFVTLIGVEENGGRWSVYWWAASGC